MPPIKRSNLGRRTRNAASQRYIRANQTDEQRKARNEDERNRYRRQRNVGFNHNRATFNYNVLEKDMTNYCQYMMGFSEKIILVPGTVPTKFHCQKDRMKRNDELDQECLKNQPAATIHPFANETPISTTDISTSGCLNTSAVPCQNLPHNEQTTNMEGNTRFIERTLQKCRAQENLKPDELVSLHRDTSLVDTNIVKEEIDIEEYVKEEHFDEDYQEGNNRDMEFEFVEVEQNF